MVVCWVRLVGDGYSSGVVTGGLRQHALNFLPLPQGHCKLRRVFFSKVLPRQSSLPQTFFTLTALLDRCKVADWRANSFVLSEAKEWLILGSWGVSVSDVVVRIVDAAGSVFIGVVRCVEVSVTE